MRWTQCWFRILLLGAVLVGCGGPGKEQLEPLLSWSPEEMGEVEPQIRRQFERAQNHLASRLLRKADHEELAQAVGQVAMLHHVYQNRDLAMTAYEVAAQLDTSDPRWPYYHGYLLAKHGDLRDAIVQYEQALKIDESLAQTRIRLAEIQVREEDYAAAELSYANLAEPARSSARALTGRGELALARQDFKLAEALFESARELEPQSHRIRLGLARALRERGEIEEARQALDSVSAVTAQDAEVGLDDPLLAALYDNDISSQRLWLVGKTLLREGHAEEALTYFQQSVEIVPDRESYNLDLASAMAQLGDLEEAVEQFQTLLLANPKYLPAWVGLARAQVRLGNSAEAETAYRTLLEIEEGHAGVHVELANLLRVRGEPAALAHYQRALELDPQSPLAYVWLAWLRFEDGHTLESLELVRQGLRFQPDNAWLASLEMRFRTRAPDEEDISDLLMEAALLLIANPTAFNAETLALVYAGLGQFENARQWQEAVVGAALDIGLDPEVMRRRLAIYEVEGLPRDVLDRSDASAARVPLRRVDFERLAATLPAPTG